MRSFLRRIWMMGNKRVCPVCGGHFRCFAPYGLANRPDAQCPGCGALERHRLVWLFWKNRTDLFDGSAKKMLHIAPEDCFEPALRRQLKDGYITADLNNPKANVKMDITQIPFDADTFDVVYCSHVLEHVPDDRLAIRQVLRVLRPGGWALLVVPITAPATVEDPTITDPAQREKLFGQHDHVRKYGPDFIERVKEAGFTVQRLTESDLADPQQIQYYGLKGNPLFYCKKKGELS